MRCVKSFVLAAASFPLLFGPAHARDPAPFNWTGFYVGAYAGGAWGNTDIRTDVGTATATSYFDPQVNADSVNQSGSGSLSPDAFVGGIQIGVNKQIGNIVFGVEADFGTFNLGGSKGASDFPYPSAPAPAFYTVRASLATDWLFTARGRVGWTASNLLIYATGGLAMTNLHVSNSFTDTAPSDGIGGASNSDIKTGWTVGGGLELALSRNWTLKGEYMYVDFGSVTASGAINCGPGSFCAGTFSSPFATSADLAAHIARVGANYKF